MKNILNYILIILLCTCGQPNNEENQEKKENKKSICTQVIDFPRYGRRRPGINIVEIDSISSTSDTCIYNIGFLLHLKKDSIIPDGLDADFANHVILGRPAKMYHKNDIFYINMKDARVSSEYIPYFNFNTPVGKSYDISFKFENQNKKITCKIIDKVINKDTIEVTIFQFLDTYYYYGAVHDIIIFASQEQGFLGSYLFSQAKGEEKIIIAPQGDILEDIIDYSDYEKMYLK